MARSKHNTALFEVLRHSQKPEATRSSNSWFGRSVASAAPADLPVVDPAITITYIEDAPASVPMHDAAQAGKRDFVFRMSHIGAAVCAFGVIVVIVGAFVLGQRTNKASAPVLAALTTEELKSLPAQPEVLEIARPVAVDPPPAEPVLQAAAETSQARTNKTWNEPKPPVTLVVQDAKRTVGLNYVLIQSYPKEEESMALSARELLTKHGIEATVERGLPGWNADWFSVVGTTGFDKIRSSPVFDAYVQSIMQVSARFAGSAKFKRFDPLAYKWRGTRSGN